MRLNTFRDQLLSVTMIFAITKYSRVLGISNIDFTPAEITVTGVFPSSVRSEDTSMAA